MDRALGDTCKDLQSYFSSVVSSLQGLSVALSIKIKLEEFNQGHHWDL